MTLIAKFEKDYDILAQLGGINVPFDSWLSLSHPGPHKFYFREFLQLEYQPYNHRTDRSYFVQHRWASMYRVGTEEYYDVYR